MEEYKTVFNHINSNNLWGDPDSTSGSGSNLTQTSYIRNILPELLTNHNVKSMLDLPCGDFFWMKEIVTELSNSLDKYTGGDIVDQLILNNQNKYQNSIFNFKRIDLLKDPITSYELIFNRDCLVHFSYMNIYRALKNFKKSKSTYLLTSTFPGSINKEIKTGKWRTIDLERFPFCLPKPFQVINERCSEYGGKFSNKSLGLWKLADISVNKILLYIIIYKVLLFLYYPLVIIRKRIKSISNA